MVVEYADPSEESVTFNSAEHDYVATVGGALGNDIFGVGLNLKYLDSSLLDEKYHANGIAVDVGGILKIFDLEGSLPINVGACIQNIGVKTGYTDYKDELPTTSRIGASTKFNMMKLIDVNLDIMPTVEWVKPVDVHGQLSVGCEVSTELRQYSGDKMMFRAGYKTGPDIKDYIIIGIGFKLTNLQLDASAAPLELSRINFGGLESDLMISFTIKF